MPVFICFIYLVLLVIIKYKIKDIISRFCLYCFTSYWSISLIVSWINPYGMQENENHTYILLVLGMVSFIVGMLSFVRFSSVKTYKVNKHSLLSSITYVVRSKILLILYIGCAVFAAKYASNALIAAELSGGALIDESRGEMIFENSSIAKLIYYYIVDPLYFITLSIISLVILSKQKHRLFIITAIVFLIGSIILGGGRSKFVIILMYIVFGYVCYNNNFTNLFKFKIIWKSIVLLLIMTIAMSFQTGYRSTGSYQFNSDSLTDGILDMGETFATYSIIPIRLFDYSLRNDYVSKFGGEKYGRATIAGVDEIACGILRRISGIKVKSTIDIVNYTQDHPVNIIPGKHPYNYCYTGLFYFYMDFGVFGIIFIPFLLGFVYRYYIFQFYKYNSLISFIIISLGFFMMMHSLFQNYFVKNWILPICVILAVIQYIFVTKKCKFSLARNIKIA